MDSPHQSVICFAHGTGAGWEALCVDFDIAVQGSSLDDVKRKLDAAVASYIEDSNREDATTRAQLLNRKAPWYVTAGLTARLIAFNLFRGRSGDAQASFPVACPA